MNWPANAALPASIDVARVRELLDVSDNMPVMAHLYGTALAVVGGEVVNGVLLLELDAD